MDRKNWRRMRAGVLVVTTILMLAAGVLPACANALCCSRGEAARIHAAMPCCAESSLAPRQSVRIQPATSTDTIADAPLPVAVATHAVAPPPAHPRAGMVSAALHNPSPPLFLRNEQFLI